MYDFCIIDDGVNEHPDLNESRIDHYRYYCVEKQVGPECHLDDTYDRLYLSHGTICTLIITSRIKDLRIASVRILDRVKRTASVESLKTALEWAYQKRIPVVHLSIGSTDLCDCFVLERVIRKMVDRQQIIIAAQSNSGKYTVPANMAGVISVKHNPNIGENAVQRCEEDGFAEPILLANGRQLVPMSNKVRVYTPASNSYAAAVVTAKVCCLLKNKILSLKTAICGSNEINRLVTQDEKSDQVLCDTLNVFFRCKQAENVKPIESVVAVHKEKNEDTESYNCTVNALCKKYNCHRTEHIYDQKFAGELNVPIVQLITDKVENLNVAYLVCKALCKKHYQAFVISDLVNIEQCCYLYFSNSVLDRVLYRLQESIDELSVVLLCSNKEKKCGGTMIYLDREKLTVAEIIKKIDNAFGGESNA